MNIGIDIDDTISNTEELLFDYAQNYTINAMKKEIKDIDSDEITENYVKEFHNWSDEEEKNFFDKYYEKMILNVLPKMYASEIIKKLREEGNKIYLITARFPSDKFDIKEKTKVWLEKNNIEYDELIVNAQHKSKPAKENHIDIFIDDNIRNCTDVSSVGIKTYMMNTIHNKDFNDGNIEKVYSWPHIYQKIKRIEKD